MRMKTKINWCIPLVRELSFDKFYSLCKGQYKKYYKKTSKKDIALEYEYLTGINPKI